MERNYSKRLVFWAACAGMLLFGISFITLGSVTTELKAKFHLSDIESGSLFAILPMGIITGSLLFGPVADRYGYKLLLLSSSLLLLVGFMGIAYAPSLTLLKLCVYFFGFGGGAINGSTNAVVSLISNTNKVGNLSLLGVFYGVGALGMPVVLGSVAGRLPYETIVLGVALITFLIGCMFLCIRFPLPQQTAPFSFKRAWGIFKNRVVVLIALFLFLQMSLEAIVNNWTTSYLRGYHRMEQDKALFGLSLFVVGMTVMRVLIGTVFRAFPERKLLWMSMALILGGSLLLILHVPFAALMTGLVLLGAGMSAGVPLMLGMIGALYRDMAGTAFSMVIVIGLLGNLALNYLMGYLVEAFGIHYFGYMLVVEWFFMAITSGLIIWMLRKQISHK